MRALLVCLSLVFLALGLVAMPGCGGSNEATVAPRSAEEVEAYKAEVYAAEEEDAVAHQQW